MCACRTPSDDDEDDDDDEKLIEIERTRRPGAGEKETREPMLRRFSSLGGEIDEHTPDV